MYMLTTVQKKTKLQFKCKKIINRTVTKTLNIKSKPIHAHSYCQTTYTYNKRVYCCMCITAYCLQKVRIVCMKRLKKMEI